MIVVPVKKQVGERVSSACNCSCFIGGSSDTNKARYEKLANECNPELEKDNYFSCEIDGD